MGVKEVSGARTVAGGLALAGLAFVCGFELVDGLASPEPPPPAALAAGAGSRLPGPAPDGPRRLLVLLADAVPPLGAPRLPGGVGAGRFELVGRAVGAPLEAVVLGGLDAAALAPPGWWAWPQPELPGLLESARDAGFDVHVFGPGAWGARAGARLRTFDLLDPGAEPEEARAARVLERLRSRIKGEPLGRRGEFWIARLQGAPTGAELEGASVEFLARGRALVLAVPTGMVPGGTRHALAIGRALGSSPEPAVLELEDLAPSLAAAAGLPLPGGAVGVARPDLLLPDDPRGAYAAMAFVREEAMARRRALAAALGCGALPAADPGPAGLAYREGRFRDACTLSAAGDDDARRALRGAIARSLGRPAKGAVVVAAVLGTLLGLALGAGAGLGPVALGATGVLLAAGAGGGAGAVLGGREHAALEVLLATPWTALLPGLWIAAIVCLPLLVGVGAGALDGPQVRGAWASALALLLAGGAYRLGEAPVGLARPGGGWDGVLASLALGGGLLLVPVLGAVVLGLARLARG